MGNLSQHEHEKNALGKVKFSSNEEIKHVAKLFPYSLPIQAMLSRNLVENKHLDYDKFLRLSSVLSPDRKWLYNYIHGKSVESIKIIEDQVNDKIQEKIESSEHKKSEKPPVENLILNENDKESFDFDIPELVIPEAENPLNTIEDDLMVTQVLEEVSTQAEQIIENKTVEKEEQIKPQVFTPEITSEKENNVSLVDKYKISNKLEIDLLNVAIDKSIQKEVAETTVFSGTEQVEETQQEAQPEDFSFWLNPAKKRMESREEKLKKIDQLIEKFIKTEPRIVPKKAEFYSPANVAKQSVEFDENLVSEPLAAIFEKQGYFDKAIKAYEKLSLKFPEKRTYFAARIEKIREIIKNIKNNK